MFFLKKCLHISNKIIIFASSNRKQQITMVIVKVCKNPHKEGQTFRITDLWNCVNYAKEHNLPFYISNNGRKYQKATEQEVINKCDAYFERQYDQAFKMFDGIDFEKARQMVETSNGELFYGAAHGNDMIDVNFKDILFTATNEDGKCHVENDYEGYDPNGGYINTYWKKPRKFTK